MDSRHAVINDIIYRCLVSAKIPSRLEPSGLSRSHGRRPDGMSIVPWTSGNLLVGYATCTDTYTPFNVVVAGTGTGVLAEKSEQHKIFNYSHWDWTYMLFQWQLRHQAS